MLIDIENTRTDIIVQKYHKIELLSIKFTKYKNQDFKNSTF